MNMFLKTIFLLIAGMLMFGLFILFLPLFIILYLFLPQKRTQNWFQTFTRTASSHNPFSNGESPASEQQPNHIPASEDIIDVKADEVKDNTP